MNTLKKLRQYAGKRKILFPLSMIISAISALASILPFVLIWLIVKELFETGGTISPSGNISTYAWWAAGSAIISVTLYFVALMLSHLAAFRVESNMRLEAMRKIVKMPLGFFDTTTSGRIRKIIDDNAGITHSFLAHQLPDLAATILMPIVAMIMIFAFDWQLGLACILPIFLSMILMMTMMGGKSQQFMQNYMTSLEEMNTEAVEYVRGIPVVKVFQQTIFSFKNFHKSIINYNKMVTEYTLSWKKPMSAYTVVINGFVFILAPVAILLIGNTGNFAGVLLNFFLFILVTPIFSQSIMKSMYLQQALGQATEAIDRFDKLVDVELLSSGQKSQQLKNFDISFNSVSFKYPGAAQNAVDNISFSIPQGNTLALVGASGSGKTTIARLVPRFWDVQNGKIKLGGQDISRIEPETLLKHYSVVFQDVVLFNASIMDNIRIGKRDASDSEVLKAAQMAQCDEFVNKMSQGYNTIIGENGETLSGGERQRVSIARALLKDAPIVLLDEATASLDVENETKIQAGISALVQNKTGLIIAHRMRTVANADKIVVLDKGSVVETGSPEELQIQNGIFAGMLKKQITHVN